MFAFKKQETTSELEAIGFAVRIEEILSVDKHPNADRLELATVRGWQVVVQKNAFKIGDKCVYFPIDSILPHSIEERVFGPESKIKLNKSRVKTIKLRGAISQGLVTPLDLFKLKSSLSIGSDMTALFGVTKYEPPAPAFAPLMGKRKKALENPHFFKYGGIENFKNYTELFKEGEMVSITEKIHGTSTRAGWVKSVPNTLWRKLLKFFGKFPEYEFVYGSNNVQLQQKGEKGNYYGTSVYGKIMEAYKLREILKPNEVVYGEIYGDGIQKNYSYGCKSGEHKLALFDLKRDGAFASVDEFKTFCEERGLPMVPEVYRGAFSKEGLKALTKGESVLAPAQKIREGVVVKPLLEEKAYIGRKFLKAISDEYLLGNQSDYH